MSGFREGESYITEPMHMVHGEVLSDFFPILGVGVDEGATGFRGSESGGEAVVVAFLGAPGGSRC